MQKLNSSGTHCNTLPRDAELQLRLADSGGSGEGKENGAGGQFLPRTEEGGSFCTKRRMLVGLDLICLCVGKIEAIIVAMIQQTLRMKFNLISAFLVIYQLAYILKSRCQSTVFFLFFFCSCVSAPVA